METFSTKEEFVTGHHGSTCMDVIFAVVGSVVLPILLERVVARGPLAGIILVEGICFAIPIVLVPIDFCYGVLASVWAVLIITVAEIAFERDTDTRSNNCPSPKTGNESNDRHPRFITTYRGVMMLLTCATILSVDFRVFPRRHAKTEVEGVSLMDVGVGAMVFSGGISSRDYRSLHQQQSLKKFVFQSFILILLGLGRFFTVTAVDYAVHRSEYGVHWNFFLTLASLSMIHGLMTYATDVLGFVLTWMHFMALGITVAFLHEYGLKNGLRDFVENSPRIDFWSSNKEGLVSLTGYYALFLFGASAGKVLKPQKSMLQNLFLILGAIISLVLFNLSSDPPSRRVVNYSYILWICFGNFLVLILIAVIDASIPLSPSQLQSTLTASTSRNQLLVFLLANILTGVTNLSFDTLAFSDLEAISWLMAYLLVLTVCTKELSRRRLSVKDLLNFLSK